MRLLAVLVLTACGGGLSATNQTHRVAYPNGFARFEFELRDGLPNGRGRVWYRSGALELEGTYVDGARHGRFWFFDENGVLQYQAVYENNAEVWRSADPKAVPPPGTSDMLAAEVPPTPLTADRVTTSASAPSPTASTRPAPSFHSLDRITMDRGGVQLGVGAVRELDFGSVVRVDAFGHYRFSRFGAYVQATQTRVQRDMATLSGRRTVELGGTARGLLGPPSVTLRSGLLLPIGSDDTNGFVASNAGAAQRPTDAASTFASSVAARTGASFVRAGDRSVLQVDAGIDWLLGTEARPIDVLLRANAGIGLGSRRALFTVELSNTVRPTEGTSMHALVVGGTATFEEFWVAASLSVNHEAETSMLTSLGYDL